MEHRFCEFSSVTPQKTMLHALLGHSIIGEKSKKCKQKLVIALLAHGFFYNKSNIDKL